MAIFQIQIDHADKMLVWGNGEDNQPFMKICANEGGRPGAVLLLVENCWSTASIANMLKQCATHGFTELEIRQAYTAYRDNLPDAKANSLAAQLFGQPFRLMTQGQLFGLVRGCILDGEGAYVEVVYAIAPDRQWEVIPVVDEDPRQAMCEAVLWLRQRGMPESAEVPDMLPPPPLAEVLARIKALNAACDEAEETDDP
jgi:hypothetical protein